MIDTAGKCSICGQQVGAAEWHSCAGNPYPNTTLPVPGVASTCMECGILRAHMLNLERELAEVTLAYNTQAVERFAEKSVAGHAIDQLERELAEALGIYINQNTHLKRICGELTAARAEVDRLRGAIHAALDSACAMGADDIDVLAAALSRREP